MRKTFEYSHLGGAEILHERFGNLDSDIDKVIATATPQKTKKSREKNKMGRMLYNPTQLNKDFKELFRAHGWSELRDRFTIEIPQYPLKVKGAYKQVDFRKDEVLCEVQLGKYAFMFYDLAKFQYFYNKGRAKVGVEIVPSHALKKEMSSGVSFGEQLIYDLNRIGRNFPQVPVKVILVDP